MTLVLMHIINQYTVNHSDYTDVNEKKKKKGNWTQSVLDIWDRTNFPLIGPKKPFHAWELFFPLRLPANA